MVAVAQILLRDLPFGHLARLRHSAKEGAVGFARLEVDGAVLDLNNHVVEELPVERLELEIGLLGTIGIGWAIDEGTPHDDALERLQRLGQHIGALGVGASEVIRARLAFGVGLHEEASEVGDELVDLLHLGRPPLLYILVERVGSFEATDDHGRSEVDGEIGLHAVGTHDVGHLLYLLQVFGGEHLGRSVDVVGHVGIDADGGIGTCIVAQTIDRRNLGRILGMEQVLLVDFAISISTHLVGTVAPEDGATGIAALDGAVEVVPMVEDADVVGRLFDESSVTDVGTRLLHTDEVVGTIEQTYFGCRLDDRRSRLDGDAERAVGQRLHGLVELQDGRSAFPTLTKLGVGNFECGGCRGRRALQP